MAIWARSSFSVRDALASSSSESSSSRGGSGGNALDASERFSDARTLAARDVSRDDASEFASLVACFADIFALRAAAVARSRRLFPSSSSANACVPCGLIEGYNDGVASSFSLSSSSGTADLAAAAAARRSAGLATNPPPAPVPALGLSSSARTGPSPSSVTSTSISTFPMSFVAAPAPPSRSPPPNAATDAAAPPYLALSTRAGGGAQCGSDTYASGSNGGPSMSASLAAAALREALSAVGRGVALGSGPSPVAGASTGASSSSPSESKSTLSLAAAPAACHRVSGSFSLTLAMSCASSLSSAAFFFSFSSAFFALATWMRCARSCAPAASPRDIATTCGAHLRASPAWDNDAWSPGIAAAAAACVSSPAPIVPPAVTGSPSSFASARVRSTPSRQSSTDETRTSSSSSSVERRRSSHERSGSAGRITSASAPAGVSPFASGDGIAAGRPSRASWSRWSRCD
eukprot:31439-Pelagococcus_subviridis.AAC.24